MQLTQTVSHRASGQAVCLTYVYRRVTNRADRIVFTLAYDTHRKLVLLRWFHRIDTFSIRRWPAWRALAKPSHGHENPCSLFDGPAVGFSAQCTCSPGGCTRDFGQCQPAPECQAGHIQHSRLQSAHLELAGRYGGEGICFSSGRGLCRDLARPVATQSPAVAWRFLPGAAGRFGCGPGQRSPTDPDFE